MAAVPEAVGLEVEAPLAAVPMAAVPMAAFPMAADQWAPRTKLGVLGMEIR